MGCGTARPRSATPSSCRSRVRPRFTASTAAGSRLSAGPSGDPSGDAASACPAPSPGTPCLRFVATRGGHHPQAVVHLLVVRLAGERPGHGRDPHPPPPLTSRRLPLPHHHRHLVLDRVWPLLPRVEPPLPPSRPGGGPLGGVEKNSRISSGSSSTRSAGMRKIPARSGWRGFMLRPTLLSSRPNRKPRKAWVVYVR